MAYEPLPSTDSRRRTRSRPAGVAASLALVLLVTACAERDPVAAEPAANPAPGGVIREGVPVAAAPAAQTVRGPQISFEKAIIDLGDVPDTQRKQTTYSFANIGDATLIIYDVKAACGCTVPTLARKEYAPGERGKIDVEFNPKGRSGASPKQITVLSNSRTNGSMKLTLTSNVQPLLGFESRFLRLETIPLGERFTQTVTATYRDPDLEIRSVTSNNAHVHGRVLEIGEVESSSADEVVYRAVIEVTVDESAPWGTLYATRLTLDVRGRPEAEAAPADHAYELFMYGHVFGQLRSFMEDSVGRATPTSVVSVRILERGQDYESALSLVRDSGEPFTVLDASVLKSRLPGMEVVTDQVLPSQWNVTVRGNTGTYAGPVEGTIEVVTDVPGEDVLILNLAGQVR